MSLWPCAVSVLSGTVLRMSSAYASLPPMPLLDGPWVQAFLVDLDLPIRSKSNFRRSRQAARSQWASLRDFESDLALLVRMAMPQGWETGQSSAPLPSRPVVVSSIVASTRLDPANLSKSVLDACQDLVFVNDASVKVSLNAGTREHLGFAGGVLGFARLLPGTTLPQQVEACARLSALATARFEALVQHGGAL